jgi:hypothetical protein
VRAEVLDRADILACTPGTSNIILFDTDLMGTFGTVSLDPQVEQTAYGVFSDLVDLAGGVDGADVIGRDRDGSAVSSVSSLCHAPRQIRRLVDDSPRTPQAVAGRVRTHVLTCFPCAPFCF